MKKLLFILAFFYSAVSAQSIPYSSTGTISIAKIFALKTTADSLFLVNEIRVNALEASILKLKASFDSLLRAVPPLPVKKYSDIPLPPFTAGTAIAPSNFCCTSPGLFDFASGRPPGNYKPNGAFVNGLSIRQASGAYRFVTTAGTVYGTQGVGQNHGISTNGAGAYDLSFYGLATAATIVTGENGFQMPSASGGSTILVQDAVAKNPNASGFTANFGISGTNYYKTVTVKNLRCFNTGQECIYEGNTGASYNGTNYINVSVVSNCFGYNLQREFIQIEHANFVTVEYNTSILAGQTTTSGQSNNFQYHDNGPGSQVRYNVFSGAKDGFSIASHGLRLHHNYISWTAFPGQILRTDNQYFAAFANRLTGDSIIVENNCFKKLGGSDSYAVKVEERTAPIIFRNNTIDGSTTMYLDNRAIGYTNTITGQVGNHGNVIGTCGPPEMAGSYSDPDNYPVQGLQTSTSPWYDWGYRGLTH